MRIPDNMKKEEKKKKKDITCLEEMSYDLLFLALPFLFGFFDIFCVTH